MVASGGGQIVTAITVLNVAGRRQSAVQAASDDLTRIFTHTCFEARDLGILRFSHPNSEKT